MKVAAVARQVGEGLRHEGRDQAALLGHRLDHVAVEDRAVAARERVGEVPVLLELPVRVLVVGRVHLPAQRVHVADDVGDEVERPGERADVVTRLLEGVERVRDLDPAVLGLADEEVLELAADLELEAGVGGALDLAPQDRPRAVGPRLALDGRVAGEPGDLRLPRQPGEAGDVGHRDQVRVVGRLADVAGGVAGESGAVGEQAVELLRRHQLGARLRVHVDELREQELDPLVGDRARARRRRLGRLGMALLYLTYPWPEQWSPAPGFRGTVCTAGTYLGRTVDRAVGGTSPTVLRLCTNLSSVCPRGP